MKTQTQQNELNTEKRGEPRIGAATPGKPKERQRYGDRHKANEDHAAEFSGRVEFVRVNLVHETGHRWVDAAVAIEDVAAKGRYLTNFSLAVVGGFGE